MAKYKVLKDFMDKNTKVKHGAGTDYEADAKRGNELIKLGFVKKTVNKDESK